MSAAKPFKNRFCAKHSRTDTDEDRLAGRFLECDGENQTMSKEVHGEEAEGPIAHIATAT